MTIFSFSLIWWMLPLWHDAILSKISAKPSEEAQRPRTARGSGFDHIGLYMAAVVTDLLSWFDRLDLGGVDCRPDNNRQTGWKDYRICLR